MYNASLTMLGMAGLRGRTRVVVGIEDNRGGKDVAPVHRGVVVLREEVVGSDYCPLGVQPSGTMCCGIGNSYKGYRFASSGIGMEVDVDSSWDYVA
jgi:hypothetical protein